MGQAPDALPDLSNLPPIGTTTGTDALVQSQLDQPLSGSQVNSIANAPSNTGVLIAVAVAAGLIFALMVARR